MRELKIYWVVVASLFVATAFLMSPNSAKTTAGAAIAWILGFHVVYSYKRGKRIEFGWATISAHAGGSERAFYFLCAIATIAIGSVALWQKW